MGGSNAGSHNTIYALTYSGETEATLSATLAANKDRGCGNSSASSGYALEGSSDSGSTIVNTAYKLAFATETTSTLGATLPTALYHMCEGYWN